MVAPGDLLHLPLAVHDRSYLRFQAAHAGYLAIFDHHFLENPIFNDLNPLGLGLPDLVEGCAHAPADNLDRGSTEAHGRAG